MWVLTCYSACVESRRPLSAVSSTVVSTLNSGHQIVQCYNLLSVALIDTMTKSHLEKERVDFAYALRSQFITDGSQGWNWSRNHGGMVLAGLLPSLCSATPLIQPRPTCWGTSLPTAGWALTFPSSMKLLTDKTTSQSDVDRSLAHVSSWPLVASGS